MRPHVLKPPSTGIRGKSQMHAAMAAPPTGTLIQKAQRLRKYNLVRLSVRSDDYVFTMWSSEKKHRQELDQDRWR
jgi:hypothetical protein